MDKEGIHMACKHGPCLTLLLFRDAYLNNITSKLGSGVEKWVFSSLPLGRQWIFKNIHYSPFGGQCG